MRARYYDPEIGRFISEDPIGLEAGVNLYAYVGGNPLNYIDPDGNIALPLIAVLPIIGGTINAGVAALTGGNVGAAFVGGAVGTLVGLGIGNPFAGGAAAGFVSEGVNQLIIGGGIDTASLATATIAGTIAGPIGARLHPNPVGRPPLLGKPRDLRQLGTNSQHRIRREGTTSIVGATAGQSANILRK